MESKDIRYKVNLEEYLQQGKGHVPFYVSGEIKKILKRNKDVDVIEAPWEADSELMKLKLLGIIDTVATTDADLLIFGTSILSSISPEGIC